MKVLILQPPIVQLNTAYPSGAYLSAFFKKIGHETKWVDLSLELYYEIFSRAGLSKLFSLCSEKALKLADEAEKKGDEATCFNIRRYISQQKLWIDWIDFITAILRPGKAGTENNETPIVSGYENAHRFVFGAHVPRGNRMETYLENLDHQLTTDDARYLASYALADLADFITAVFDQNFSLVRYAESLTVSESSFAQVEKGADSPILKNFYEPLLHRLFLKNGESGSRTADFAAQASLVLISIPFAGTFAASLSTGRFFKQNFPESYISYGGGFVNTELRQTCEPALSKYCNCISYDRGYASYKKLVEQISDNSPKTPIFKLRQFIKEADGSVTVIEPAAETAEDLSYEKEMTSSIIPDFSDMDYSRYPRLIDDTNPMHRLWSDGAWIKAYMAHGCYWHKCSFCDVTLDYVCGFCPTNITKLYEGLLAQCKEKGVYGIHFVDEAMPPAMMVGFAKENLKHGSPITWWGNVRFEKYFTRDVADFLSAGGLIGVSAGLESATGNGLNAIHKGTDLESIVGACCAFKEAGILVHAYMIYGYWWEKPQDLINSMETLRQFYANGLLDSCFWHKFVLTRHSRVYKEWTEGKITDLKPIEPNAGDGKNSIPLFAKNGLHFEGEKNSEKYGASLDYSLDQWMHGIGLEKPVYKWFSFQVPKPSVPQDFIGSMIEKYEHKRDEEFKKAIPQSEDKVFWLGGEQIKLTNDSYGWFYMGEFYQAKSKSSKNFLRGKGLCVLP